MKYSTFPLFLIFVLLTGCGNQLKGHQPEIIIQSMRGPFSGGFYAIRPDGGRTRYVPMGIGDEPDWSKDGKWVIFVKHNFFDFNATQLILMRANGSHRIPLTDKQGDSNSPSWSPDGHTIAYEDNWKIYTIDVSCLVDGKSPKECPISPKQIADGFSPDWDPSGNRIVYNTYESPSHDRWIKVINADGTGPIETISTPVQYCREPKWSPDGEEIVFGCGGGDMYRIQKDGTLLTSYLDLGISGGNPQWSPDGDRIFFVSVMGDDLRRPLDWEGTIGSNALFSMRPDGTDVLRLTSRSDENILWFSWMP